MYQVVRMIALTVLGTITGVYVFAIFVMVLVAASDESTLGDQLGSLLSLTTLYVAVTCALCLLAYYDAGRRENLKVETLGIEWVLGAKNRYEEELRGRPTDLETGRYAGADLASYAGAARPARPTVSTRIAAAALVPVRYVAALTFGILLTLPLLMVGLFGVFGGSGASSLIFAVIASVFLIGLALTPVVLVAKLLGRSARALLAGWWSWYWGVRGASYRALTLFAPTLLLATFTGLAATSEVNKQSRGLSVPLAFLALLLPLAMVGWTSISTYRHAQADINLKAAISSDRLRAELLDREITELTYLGVCQSCAKASLGEELRLGEGISCSYCSQWISRPGPVRAPQGAPA
ncbi:MAG: hypothetical protein JWQ74_381 [Marmoricola sp.]|nr:hypothetical protein [Marmoricola sp.]